MKAYLNVPVCAPRIETGRHRGTMRRMGLSLANAHAYFKKDSPGPVPEF